ncbi:MAG: methyltransferase [Candidatus Nitrosocaldus sp.]|nr:methyltransferase [Candidatus Nitrosocaldus sp.]MCS7141164.1 methyltransferase [Candidatus Nitrosocaldus sp.]MDW8000129.1 methyltransferase [Candidatus Nitrosocaldus sp.]MDW8275586.1 methyltransferase [Candidatus Nitrosocaldus sp.]
MGDEIYRPAEDTFMLADAVDGVHGCYALEIGTGSGYIASILSKGFRLVVATDVSLEALIYAKESHPDSRNVEFVCCSNADPIAGISFDLIAINPPYLPSQRIEDVAVDGGEQGIEVAMAMLRSASRLLSSGGRVIMVTSSLAGYDLLLSSLHGIGLEGRVTARKRYGFEDLILLEIRHAAQPHRDHRA